MKVLAGIFHSAVAAKGAGRALHAAGITESHLMLLTPDNNMELRGVSSEHPAGACDVRAGHVLGATTGFAGGLLGGAMVSLLVPGVGPILAVGTLMVSTIVGVTVGATLGGLVQDTFTLAFPPEEVFVYEEALRQGCSLLLVKPTDEGQVGVVQTLFARLGAERTDDMREQWWKRVRKQEAITYHDSPQHFAAHEVSYRRGFEAALDARDRGKTYAEAVHVLATRDPAMYQDDVFRQGFERGQVYYHVMLECDLLKNSRIAAVTH